MIVDNPDLQETLRRAIADGDYAPGSKLVERELTLRYDVGRTKVRDALRHLSAEGIVELTENRGARVRELDYEETLNIYQVRAVLEGLAGELFAIRGSADAKVHFAEALPPIRDAIEAGDVTRALRAADRFYALLLDGAGNPELHRTVDRLHVRISQARRVSLSATDQGAATVRSLQRIVDAVLGGDSGEAGRACAAHVKGAAAATLPLLAIRRQE
ncbi:MAG: GntR family transcriptional regulator [Microbacterium sp.]|uniref:GntR family transcriptional regulator n=1 Tax=Microbacterium sp. TaxID=51671 RepID=UPI001D4AD49F|nr:GntR family transcriptional regulator [Microbacterium sp.]MBW8763272.1 GntR family transcriptional regulator [Microbacterium sp.]